MSSTNKETKISNSKSACVIVEGTLIEGEFYSKSDTRLDGTINGNIICDARLIMGNTGEINGNIKSNDVLIAGKFEGEMTVKDSLSLKATANINGQISTKKIDVEEGAIFNGNILTVK